MSTLVSRHLFVILFTVASVSAPILAKNVSALEFKEYRALAEELSQKVVLFREGWEQDPAAEFVGGTTRDYLYWLKNQFAGADTREKVEAVKTRLRNEPAIDVRDFVIGDSDVDVVASSKLQLEAARYGVRKIDRVSRERFDPATELGKNEIHQGHIPVEKIRLGKNGFVPWPGFGDGIREIFYGKPTLVRPEPNAFAQTYYARQKLNHEVLLGLRYLRILAANYYYEHGKGFPDEKKLKEVDTKSWEALLQIFQAANSDATLPEYFKQELFVRWANQNVQKTFRSYTNPTAAFEYFKMAGADLFAARYADFIEPTNQYLFAKDRLSTSAHDQALRSSGFSPETLFTSPAKLFSNGILYHGTKSEPAFRNILLQGILPSTGGNAGQGLYGVAKENISFAETWGGDPNRVVGFRVKPNARIVDVTSGEGERLRKQFTGTDDEFCERYAIDILKYPYDPPAYVVKNSSVLEKPEGVYRSVLTFSKALERTASIHDTAAATRFVSELALSSFRSDEIFSLLTNTPFIKQQPDGNRIALTISRAGSVSMVPFDLVIDIIRLDENTSATMKSSIGKRIASLMRPMMVADFGISAEQLAKELSSLTTTKTKPLLMEIIQREYRQYEGWRYRLNQFARKSWTFVPAALGGGLLTSIGFFSYLANGDIELLKSGFRYGAGFALLIQFLDHKSTSAAAKGMATDFLVQSQRFANFKQLLSRASCGAWLPLLAKPPSP